MNKNEVLIMKEQNIKQIWYSKKDVLKLFPMSERTYFRKIKNLPPQTRIKKFKSKRGKKTILIYFRDLPTIFEIKRRPSDISNKENLRKYVGTQKWNFVGNIVPGRSTISEVQEKMKYLFQNLKSKDQSLKLFFSLEKNTSDDYYHSHFLIKSSLQKKDIMDQLEIVCDKQYHKERRIDLKTYDFERYQFRGSFYSDKFGVYDTKKYQPYIYSDLLW
jgi:hypothetical protein